MADRLGRARRLSCVDVVVASTARAGDQCHRRRCQRHRAPRTSRSACVACRERSCRDPAALAGHRHRHDQRDAAVRPAVHHDQGRAGIRHNGAACVGHGHIHGSSGCCTDVIGDRQLECQGLSGRSNIVYKLKEHGLEDRLTDELVGALRRGGHRILTTASDGTSQRMRDFIQRRTSEQQLQNAAELARKHRMKRLKLYVIIGIPGETDEDLDELVGLTQELAGILPTALGLSPLVPKLHTPLGDAEFAGVGHLLGELVGELARESFLKNALEPILDRYDYILIDCPPSLGLLTLNGIIAAKDGVIIPVQCEYLPLEGLSQLNQTLDRVRNAIFTDLKMRGVLLTMYDARTNLSNDVVREVREHYSDQVFESIIPRTVRLAEAPSYGQPISVYAPTSSGATAYAALAREVLLGDGVKLPVLEF